MRLSLVLLIAIGASACDEDIVAPPLPSAHFTIWGSLNPDTSIQAVRVVPLLPTIDAEKSPEPLDAVLTSTDLATGEVTVWSDSVVSFPGGRFGHVYHATVAMPYESHQFVQITRSDGAETTALVRLPPDVTPVLGQPDNTRPYVTYHTLWPNAPNLNVLSVRYDLQTVDCNLVSITAPGRNGDIAEPTSTGWRASLPLNEIRARETFDRVGSGFTILHITLEALVSGPDAIPPDGAEDPALWIQPGQFSNVNNGFGLVFGAYRRTISWKAGSAYSYC